MTYVVEYTHYGQGIVLGTYTDDIDVLHGVGVCSTDSVAIGMWMDDADLHVDGEVLGFGIGAWIVGNDAHVTVGALGQIGANSFEYATALEVQGGSFLVENDGYILSFDTGVQILGGNGTSSTLVNRGAITGNRVGIFRDPAESDSLADVVVITNTGSIQGTEAAISVHAGLDAQEVVNNRGYIYGDVSLGLGSDLYDGHGGTVAGRVLLGGGADRARPGAASEIIDGGPGQDTLDFSGGPAVVVSLIDPIRNTGAARGDDYSGFENISGSAGADDLTGNGASNTLQGLGGNDTMDGGAGADRLEGGAGNDTYVLAASGDTLVEAAGSGIDLVNASYSYALGANFENLALTGSGHINATGNGLVNTLTGNSGNNVLNGGAGADTMRGGAGNDLYHVDNSGDRTEDTSGVDTALSTASFILGAGVENLTLQGSASLNGTGNYLGNELMGNSGRNVLKGGSGNDELEGGKAKDKLTGGQGNDEFIFASLRDVGDTVTDFGSRKGDSDRLVIDAAGFKGGLGPGKLSKDQFQTSKGHDTLDRDVRFIFDTRNETLWFDKNGDARGGLTLIADLQASAIVEHTDFVLI